MTVQTSQRLEERLGVPGSPYDSENLGVVSRLADVAMRPADVAIRAAGAAGGELDEAEVTKLTAPGAADPDAIIATGGSTAGVQTLDDEDLDGVIGGAAMIPARNLTLTLSSNADWDATTAVVTGEDAEGNVITEDFAIPDAGNVTRTGTKLFRKVTSVSIPAQSGTGGTFDLGVGTLLGELTERDVLGIVRYLPGRQIAEGATTEFAAGDTLAVIHRGRVNVEVEEAVEDGARVFVRVVAAGAEVLGAFRGSRDGTASAPDAVPIKGWRFHGPSELRDGTRYAVIQIG